MNKPLDMPDTLAEAERFQRLFVMPMVDAVRTEVASSIKPIADAHQLLVKQQAEHGDRITSLEGRQNKALVGYAVFASGLSVILATSWEYLRSIFGYKHS
jgi:hypothetical protein